MSNVKEQNIKLRREIMIRFAKGFLAKEVLFLILLSILMSTMVNIVFFEDGFRAINFGIGVIAVVFYFLKFYKTKKTSIGAALMGIVLIPIYITVYSKNPL